MKKVLFLFAIAVVVLSSCRENELRDDVYLSNSEGNTSNLQKREGFKVKKGDVEKIVDDFFDQNSMRSTASHPKISSINIVKSRLTQTRSETSSSDETILSNLLYLVNLDNKSTIVVSGDKRTVPVYAHFDNLELNINRDGELVSKDTIPGIVVAFIENCIADVKNTAANTDKLDSYYTHNSLRNSTNSFQEIIVQPKLSFRFPNSHNYNGGNSGEEYGVFTAYDIRVWIIHSLCIAIPDGVEIRMFNKYKLKGSWIKEKTLPVNELSGIMYQDFIGMVRSISDFSGGSIFVRVPEFAEHFIARTLDSFSGKDGLPSLSYDKDWYNMLNNLKLETGISFITGYHKRKHPTWFRHTSYSDFRFFIADGYMKNRGNYYIHVVGPKGTEEVVSGYIWDFNKKHAGRFEDSRWTEEVYGAPYRTTAINIHTTKY